MNDLLKYHRIDTNIRIEDMTKSEASRMIDKIHTELWPDAEERKENRMSNRYNNYEKKRRIVAGVIVVILVAAMILPLLVYAL